MGEAIDPAAESELFAEAKDYLDRFGHAQSLLRSAMSITKLGVWMINLSNNRVEVSDEVFKIIGLSPDVFDNTIEFINNRVIHPDFRDEFAETLRFAIEHNKVIQNEYRVLRTDGTEGWVRINGDVVVHDETNVKILIGTILDISAEVHTMRTMEENFHFLKTLVDAIPNPVFYKNETGTYQFCNDAFLEYLGLSVEQVIGHGVYDIAPKNLADVYYEADASLMATKGKQVYDARVQYSDGNLHDVVFNKATVTGPTGQVMGLVGIMQDVTEEKAFKHQLSMLHKVKDIFIELNHTIFDFEDLTAFFEAMLKKLVGVFDNCDQSSVLEIDDSGRVRILCSIGFKQAEAEAFTMHIEDSFLWKHTGGDLSKACIIENPEQYTDYGSPKIISTIPGRSIASSISIPIYYNEKTHWIVSLDSFISGGFTRQDLTSAEYILEEIPIFIRVLSLHHENIIYARIDPLTGVMNRGYFSAILDDRLESARRTNKPLQIVVFDLDGLKKINDQFGHQAGDCFIKTFTQLLQKTIRKSDALGRIGGDEFVCAFSNSNQEDIHRMISGFQNRFEQQIIQSGNVMFKGGFSFGIASFGIDAIEKELLLQIADQRMYDNKRKIRK